MRQVFLVLTLISVFLVSATGVSAVPIPLVRLAGPSRIETAVAVAQHMYPAAQSATGVIIARADNAADALTVAPLANAMGGLPVLLTQNESLHPAVQAELHRLLSPSATVLIAGGPAAISPGIESQIKGLGFQVDRVAGETRFHTAVEIAKRISNYHRIDFVGLADQADWRQALVFSPVAAKRNGVVLYIANEEIPEVVKTYIASIQHDRLWFDAFCGPNNEAPDMPECWASEDMAAASVAIAEEYFQQVETVGVATGRDFPDALAGAALMARENGPILLAEHGYVVRPVQGGVDQAIQSIFKPASIFGFGGPNVLPSPYLHHIADTYQGQVVLNPAGSGCSPGGYKDLPDGDWYLFETASFYRINENRQSTAKPGQSIAWVEGFLACYDPESGHWRAASHNPHRLMQTYDLQVALAMGDRPGDFGSIAKYTIRGGRLVGFEPAMVLDKLNLSDVPDCVFGQCDW